MSYNAQLVSEAEQAVLGSMLIDERTVGPVLAALEPGDFVFPHSRRIFLAFRKVFASGQPADLVTVLAELRGDMDYGDEIGNFMRQCMELTPSAANWQAYAKVLKEQSRLRRLNDLAEDLRGAATLEDAAAVVSKINAQMVSRQEERTLTMEQALLAFYADQKAKPDYLRWGIHKLDQRLYISRGKFILLGGYPSDGKTALALSMAYTQARTRRVGFFSLETDAKTITRRIVSSVAQVQMGRIMANAINEDDYARIAEHADAMTRRELLLIDAAGYTVDDIFAQALAQRLDVLYIDYLQLISGDDPRANRFETITNISIALHNGARTTGINVVALSQLNRSDARDPPKPKKGQEGPVRVKAPNMHNLRESGQLEQDADVILLLYRPYPDKSRQPERCLDIAKNKEGRLGSIDLLFDGETQTFHLPEPTPGEHYQQLHEDIRAAANGTYVPPEEADWTQQAEAAEELQPPPQSPAATAPP